VPLSIFWYVTHNPVTVPELKTSGFASHGILKMARKTAYACTETQFTAARELVQDHGPHPCTGPPCRRLRLLVENRLARLSSFRIPSATIRSRRGRCSDSQRSVHPSQHLTPGGLRAELADHRWPNIR